MTHPATSPCVIGHTVRGTHLDGCTDTTCTGCRPAQASPGSWVCDWHERGVRDALRDLPDLYDWLAEPITGQRNGVRTSSDGQPLPMSDAARQERHAIRLVLHAWVKILAEDHHVTTPADNIPALSHTVAVHAGRLLNGEHAEQLVHDLTGSTDEDGNRTRGVAGNARAILSSRSRTAGIRIPCPTCTEPVRLDPDAEIHTCTACGEWGTIGWWRTRLDVDGDRPLTLAELPHWLTARRGLVVTAHTLRHWADEGRITPVEPTEPGCLGPGGRPIRRFDPVAVAAIVIDPARRIRTQ